MGEHSELRGPGTPGTGIVIVDRSPLAAAGLAALIQAGVPEREASCTVMESIVHLPASTGLLIVGSTYRGADVRAHLDRTPWLRSILIGAAAQLVPARPGVRILREDAGVQELLELVRSLSPQAASRAGKKAAQQSQDEQILAMIHEGMTNREIASRLFLAESTIKWHISRLLREAGARNRTELLWRAARTARPPVGALDR